MATNSEGLEGEIIEIEPIDSMVNKILNILETDDLSAVDKVKCINIAKKILIEKNRKESIEQIQEFANSIVEKYT